MDVAVSANWKGGRQDEDLALYDVVVVGTPVYMGKIHAKVKAFLSRNSNALLGKELHYFVCGLATGDEGTAQIVEKEKTQIGLLEHEIDSFAAGVRQSV